jgi:hypothetical protein
VKTKPVNFSTESHPDLAPNQVFQRNPPISSPALAQLAVAMPEAIGLAFHNGKSVLDVFVGAGQMVNVQLTS